MPRVKLRIRGRVQGVGFRHFAKTNAEKYGLVGHTKNRIDGSVEVEVQGDRTSIQSFIGAMHIGPGYAEVGSVEITEIEENPYEKTFRVIF